MLKLNSLRSAFGVTPYKAKTAMEALGEETGLPKDSLLAKDRGFFKRTRLKSQIVKKLGVPAKDVQVPKSGPVALSGKALGKIAARSITSLIQDSGSYVDQAAVGLLGGPEALEMILNGDAKGAAKLGMQATQANLGFGGESPVDVWAKTSDGWNLK